MTKPPKPHRTHTLIRSLGLGLITGAADDDCSAIGTYAQAGAQLGYAAITVAALVFQIWGSYAVIRNVFRVLALSLPAYVASAFLAHPKMAEFVRGTFIPHLQIDRNSLAILVAIIGTSLSAYLYTWQSNEEVEEKIAAGRRTLRERRGTTDAALKTSLWDVIFGMLFSNVVMYFIILSTAATLFATGHPNIDSAAQAAQSLRPLAGEAAGLLFALGIVGVGFLAIPVMTTGAAYDLCQSTGWANGLYRRPKEAPKFYFAITLFTLAAMGLNFLGINPMRALVVAGIVQGFSTPPLMLLILLITNRKSIMGDKVNGRAINILGWVTTAVIFSASACLVASWIRH